MRMDILDKTHRNITQVIQEQNQGSIAMGRLATSNATLHNQLSLTQQGLQELVTNEDAQRAQMTDHWQCMDALDLIIQQVGKPITATVNQNLLLDAQMKGICATIKTASTAFHTNITHLRGCIIPDLRNALASLKSEVLDLHGLSVSLKSEVLELQEQVSTMKGTFTSASQAHPPPALEQETTSSSPPDEQHRPSDEAPAHSNTTDGNSPPSHWGPTNYHPADNALPPGPSNARDSRPYHCFNTSWYHNDRNPCLDNPFGDDHHGYGGPSTDRNHDCHHHFDDAPGPSQCGFDDSYGVQFSHQGYNNPHGVRPCHAPSFFPGTTVRNPYGPCHVNTDADPDTSPLRGGRITSPHAADKECQARNLCISCHDIAGLVASAYHGGINGITKWTISFIRVCGYQSFTMESANNVLPCYSSIQLLHKKVWQAWFNPRTLQSGSTVKHILKHGLLVFPKLRHTEVKDVVAFYKGLQQVLAAYLLPLMPFDAICLANNYEGLFPPGLGITACVECCTVLLEILPRLLPTTHSEIAAKILSVASASCNEYDLHWCVMELFIPDFDTTVPIAQPYWCLDTDILDFNQSHLLYFRLHAKKNLFYSSRYQTNIFLRAVAPSNYANVVTMLQTSVDAYQNLKDIGYLPNHLRIDSIATMINNNSKHCVRDIGMLRINHVTGSDNVWKMVHATGSADANDYPFCHVQGYCPRAFCLKQGRDRTPGGRGSEHRGSEGGHGVDCWGFDRRNHDPPKGRFAQPDINWYEFKPNVQCNACKLISHKAATCDILAITLFLDRYKSDMSKADWSQIELKWLSR